MTIEISMYNSHEVPPDRNITPSRFIVLTPSEKVNKNKLILGNKNGDLQTFGRMRASSNSSNPCG